MNDEYLESIKKLATGYEYEEIQTQIEETSGGIKKKVIKTKKHIPPNFQAAKYLMSCDNVRYEDKGLEPLSKEEVVSFDKEIF